MTLSSLHLFTVWRVWTPDGGNRWLSVSWGELSENRKYPGVYKVSLWGVIFLKHAGKWSARHTFRISHDSTASVIAGDAWITIKLSAVNNCLCEMSMLCCCFFSRWEWFSSWLKMASWNYVARYCCHLLHCCDTTVQTAESPKNNCEFSSLTRSRHSTVWIL